MDQSANPLNATLNTLSNGFKTHYQSAAKAIPLFGTLFFGAGTAIFAYAGTYTRYWADDYCYSAVLQQSGFLGGIVEWYKYSGNRFSTLIAVAFSELFGRSAIALIPAAVLLMWIGVWVFFSRRLSRLVGWNLSWRWLVLLALVEVYFSALLAPDRLQTIYWRMGTFHYTLPLALLLLILGLAAGGCVDRPLKRTGLGLIFVVGLLAFFAAGFSETFAALQTAVFGLGLLACAVFLWGKPLLGQRLGLVSAGLVGSTLAMILMLLSPSNALRQAALPPPDNLLVILPYSLRYAADFVFYTVRGQIVPFGIYLVVILAMSLLGKSPLSQKASLVGALVSLPLAYFLIVCSFAPSAFAGLAYPAGRALMPGAFILLVGSGAAAFFVAQWIRGAIPVRDSWRAAAAGLLLFATCLYPVRAIQVQRADLAQLAPRTARWDARDAEILRAVQAGDRDLHVRQVDVVLGLEDLDPDPAFWVNRCAAIFYRANSIQAIP